MQKVFGFKVNRSTLDGAIFIEGPAVTHIGSNCKCYWFRLLDNKDKKRIIWQQTWWFPLIFRKGWSLKIRFSSADPYTHKPVTQTKAFSITWLTTLSTTVSEGDFKASNRPLTFRFSPWLSPAAAEPGARLHAETPPGPPPGTGRNQRVD